MSTELRRSFCRICHAACAIDVEVVDGRAVKVHGVADDPLFEGYTCIKGRQLPDQIHHPARLRTPLRRTPDGRFEPVGSDVALDEVADALRRIIDEHGPRAVATYTGTGGYQNAPSHPVAAAFHRAIGSVSYYTSVTIDQPMKVTSLLRFGRWEAGPHNFTDADVLVAVGYNPMVSGYAPFGGLQGSNPFTTLRRRKAEGMKLIVIDPRRTELAAQADIHLQLRPGEDACLLAGMVRLVLHEGLHDQAFCERWVAPGQLEELARAVEPYTLEYVADRCGLAAADVEAATRLFAAGPRGTIGSGTGPNMSPHPSLTEHLVLCLNALLGRHLREGDVIEAGALLQPASPRRAQVGAPMDPLTGPPSRFRNLRGYLGEMPVTTLAQEIVTPGDGQVRALIVNGGNPVAAWPDQMRTLEAMASLELLVVIDHRMSQTAEHADYVFAPRLSLERADVPPFMDMWFRAPYALYTPAVLEPEGDLLNDWEVYWELARRLEVEIALPGGPLPTDRRPSDDDVLDLVYARSRVPLDEVRRRSGTVLEDRRMTVAPPDPEATARFQVALPYMGDALVRMRSERTSAEVLRGFDPEVHRFRLISRRLKSRLNSLGGELPGLSRTMTTNHAHLHPDDMAELGVADDDLVEIRSPRAAIIGVAKASADLRRGVVSMAHSWGSTSGTDEKVRDIGSPTSRLIDVDDGYDPITGQAVQSSIPVAVTRVDDPSAAARPAPALSGRSDG
jgi:anaerobic selenocysteine-containing dehydrogenase